MKREVFESDIGESYLKATLSSGLRIYVLEKPQYNSSYAIFGTKYGSIDTIFSVNGEQTAVPEGIAHFLEHKLFESEDGDAFTKYAQTGAYANAFTSFDRTCYLFSCSNRFYENLQILLDFVQSPY
ncbi:MAG: insulinase family protein, partial [Clostridia bacterium]|nr:insulinase family protein [Clostridia bacterium]